MGIKTTKPNRDFIDPNLSLQLMSLGITDRTEFVWQLSKSKKLATLEFKHQVVKEPLEERPSILPAYSIGSILSAFPNILISNWVGKVEITAPEISDMINGETLMVIGDSLSDAVAKLVQRAIVFKKKTVQEINLSIRAHQSMNYDQSTI